MIDNSLARNVINSEDRKFISLISSIYDDLDDRKDFITIYVSLRENSSKIWTDYTKVDIGPKSILSIQGNQDQFLCEGPLGKLIWTPSLISGSLSGEYGFSVSYADSFKSSSFESGLEIKLSDFFKDYRVYGDLGMTNLSVKIDNGYWKSNVIDVKIVSTVYPQIIIPRNRFCGYLEDDGSSNYNLEYRQSISDADRLKVKYSEKYYGSSLAVTYSYILRNPGIDDMLELQFDLHVLQMRSPITLLRQEKEVIASSFQLEDKVGFYPIFPRLDSIFSRYILNIMDWKSPLNLELSAFALHQSSIRESACITDFIT